MALATYFLIIILFLFLNTYELFFPLAFSISFKVFEETVKSNAFLLGFTDFCRLVWLWEHFYSISKVKSQSKAIGW